MMEQIDEVLQQLAKSKFRGSFQLGERDKLYVKDKGFDKIKEHAYDFIKKRLAPCVIINDGKQTPTKNHPVFIAQHACGCCCRGCLEKWHIIPKEKELSDNEINYIVSLIMEWIIKEYKSNKNML